MSLESIRARVEADRYTNEQQMMADLRGLLKVAEAVQNWKEEKAQFWANAGTGVYADRLLTREAEMAAALAELEAAE